MAAPSNGGLTSAVALGSVAGIRTFGPWGTLAARGRFTNRGLRVAMLAALAGELAADKHPAIIPRTDPPSLAGRVTSGALAGRVVAGARGAGAGAAAAAATTFVTERARALAVEHSSIPEPALALAEDAAALTVAAVFTRPAGDEGDDGSDGEPNPASEEPASPLRSPVAAAALGIVASAAGTAAMTSVQASYLRATGGEQSSTPEQVGRRLIRKVTGKRVPRRHRPALNQVMHALYGTSWGAPFGLVARSGALRERPAATGLAFGAAVWGVSLIELPLLGVAPPPWRQPLTSLAPDLAFHLVFGTATTTVYRAIAAG